MYDSNTPTPKTVSIQGWKGQKPPLSTPEVVVHQ